MARHRIRSQAVGPRRVHLRHVRRLFLPRQADRRRRRRRLGDGGSDLPHQVRVEGHRHPPPRHAARVEDHAGQGVREPKIDFVWDSEVVEVADRATRARSPASSSAISRPGSAASWPSTACSLPSATRRTRRSSRARSSSIRRLHHHPRRHADEHPGRVRRWRRPGSRLSAGGHSRRFGLHGGHRRRAISGGTPER